MHSINPATDFFIGSSPTINYEFGWLDTNTEYGESSHLHPPPPPLNYNHPLHHSQPPPPPQAQWQLHQKQQMPPASHWASPPSNAGNGTNASVALKQSRSSPSLPNDTPDTPSPTPLPLQPGTPPLHVQPGRNESSSSASSTISLPQVKRTRIHSNDNSATNTNASTGINDSNATSKRTKTQRSASFTVPPVVASDSLGEDENAEERWISSSKFTSHLTTIASHFHSVSDITPANTTAIISVLAHMLETMPPKVFEYFIKQLGYQPDTSTGKESGGGPVAWRSSNAAFPYVTLPLPTKFRFHWLVSPDTAVEENTSMAMNSVQSLSFPSLWWWRDSELLFYRSTNNNAQYNILTKSPTDTNTDVGADVQYLLPNEIDLSRLIFPYYVRVNCAFERLFGYTQADIKSAFHRDGKHFMLKLIDPTELKVMNDNDLRAAMMRGIIQNTHYATFMTKYGNNKMRGLIHHFVNAGNAPIGFTSNYYTFFSLTPEMLASDLGKSQSAGNSSGSNTAGACKAETASS